MTPDDGAPIPADQLVLGDLDLTTDDLNGHTVNELVDYHDAGFTPADPTIDDSVGCRIALAAIGRLRTFTDAFLEQDARSLPAVDEGWVTGILSQINVQVRAGRDVPLAVVPDAGTVVITEGAIRAIVRAAGDHIDGMLVGRIGFTGDVARAGEPVVVRVDATVMWGQNIPDTAEALKVAIDADLRRHTHLNVTSIDVTVHDVHQAGR